MLTASVWPVVMSNGGMTATICVGVTELTKASFVGWPLPGSTMTRTGVRKFVPLIVMTVPPCGRPVAGVIVVMVGFVDGGMTFGGCAENVIDADFCTSLTVAVTVPVPALEPVSVTVAMPFVVVRMMDVDVDSLNWPMVVVNWTAVPFGTGWPLRVT